MTKLEKARTMRCLAQRVESVELDPDPKALEKLLLEYNCKNCDRWDYCKVLADTLS